MLVGLRLRGVRPIKRLSAIFRTYRQVGDQTQLVSSKLVGSLYAQPVSLALGALGGIATAGTAIIETSSPLLFGLCVALVAVAVVRVVISIWLKNRSLSGTGDTWVLGLVYETGALSYAFLVGSIGAVI
ncbi:MAG: hypothetical protein EOP93_24305, partial [Lysobacteraceae bacterium]